MRTVLSSLLAAVLFLTAGASAHGQAGDKVEVKAVKYDELAEIVRQNKGKVIMLDFWFTTCIPCLKKFSEVAALQKEYGDKGLIVITVHAYQANQERPSQEDILNILKNRGMTTTNLILDEEPDVWQKKLRITSFPSMYVFTREGKWWHFKFANDKHETEDMFPQVKQLVLDELKKK